MSIEKIYIERFLKIVAFIAGNYISKKKYYIRRLISNEEIDRGVLVMNENQLKYIKKANFAILIFICLVILIGLVANLLGGMQVSGFKGSFMVALFLAIPYTIMYLIKCPPHTIKKMAIVSITIYSYYNLHWVDGVANFRALFVFFQALILVALYLDKNTVLRYALTLCVINIIAFNINQEYFFDGIDSVSFFQYNVALIGCTILLYFITKWGNEMLLKSEERWQFALEGNGDGVWDWNIQTKEVFFSEQWKRILGYESHEVGNDLQEWENRLHPEDAERVYEEMDKHFRGKTPYYSTEHRFKIKDGTYKWILDRGKVITRSKDGKPLRMVCSYTDVTKRKQFEEELREERDRAQQYLDVAGVMFAVFDDEQKITLMNKKGCKIMGYSENELLGKDWHESFIPERIRDKLKEKYTKMITGKIIPEESYEYPVITKNGEERIISWQTVVLSDENGNVKGTLNSGKDITEQKRANEKVEALQLQLIQKEKMASLGQLTAGITHEINSPLGAIKSNTEMSDIILDIFEEYLNEPMEEAKNLKMKELIAKMKRANQINIKGCKRIVDVIGKLQNFTKLDQADWQVYDVHEGIDSALDLIETKIKQRIKIHKNYKKIPMINCVSSQINQVIMNIILNAIQSVEGEGDIFIETDVDEKFVYLVIKDTGKGIPKEQQSRIFDPNFTVKDDVVGMGLSLAISYNIIQTHHGEIFFKSEEGLGSEFIIKLPKH
ncbi:MAG: PAS domain S-box protein [Halanaerobiales bacterium]|nr:PAS domain S-box protein [Halanaerobiales bacterium]